MAGTVDVTDAGEVAAALRHTVLAFGGVDLVVNSAELSISRPLAETTGADWDVQHDVMARGSFLVSREAARVMTEQALGGDIVYICGKNALVAGPDNLARGRQGYARRTLLGLEVLLGASGGRVLVGCVCGGTFEVTEVHRFPNLPVRVGETLHWDVLALYQGILDGLRAAGRPGRAAPRGRHRLLGRRLRPARRHRRAARQPGPLP